MAAAAAIVDDRLQLNAVYYPRVTPQPPPTGRSRIRSPLATRYYRSAPY